MPKVTINDRTVEVEAGTNVIDAGHKAGVLIPHYCYHPRLTVVGQCRMCLVEITENGKKMPKQLDADVRALHLAGEGHVH